MIVVSKFLRIFAPQSSDWVSLRAVDLNEKISTIVDYGTTVHGFSVWIRREFYTPCFFITTITHLKKLLVCHYEVYLR